MNKVPAKQIYLLSIIIVGIIALSVYSTYALFTFESSTTEIVSIHTPKSLTISQNVYEYQQIKVEPNAITTTDIDIYNPFDYQICYSVWYKIIGDDDVQNKIQIFEKTNKNLKTSGVIEPKASVKLTIAIINDNDSGVKINLGTIGASQKDGSCSLNLDTDKDVIDSSYENINILTTTLLETKDNSIDIEENYLIYENLTKMMSFKNTDSIYVSTEFTYENETFTLTEAEKLTLEEYTNKYNLSLTGKYFCLEDSSCNILYKITNMEKITNEDDNNNEKEDIYNITKYDKLIGYSEGTNGLRKVNEKDYVFYGDNPNNFIYYNCDNSDNLESCELWRIVGFFYDEETKQYSTKIVRNESIGKYQFDYKMTEDINESTNDWPNSTLNKYLNEEYKLKNNYNIFINEYTQPLEIIPDLEADVKNIKNKDVNITSTINLLNLSDYLYTSSCEKNKINEYTEKCLTNNWLNNVEIPSEWTLTSKEVTEPILPEIDNELQNDIENEENTVVTPSDEIEDNPDESLETEPPVEENNYIINYVYAIGENITEVDINESLDIRPVVFLKPRMILLAGDGSFALPYVIK